MHTGVWWRSSNSSRLGSLMLAGAIWHPGIGIFHETVLFNNHVAEIRPGNRKLENIGKFSSCPDDIVRARCVASTPCYVATTATCKMSRWQVDYDTCTLYMYLVSRAQYVSAIPMVQSSHACIVCNRTHMHRQLHTAHCTDCVVPYYDFKKRECSLATPGHNLASIIVILLSCTFE